MSGEGVISQMPVLRFLPVDGIGLKPDQREPVSIPDQVRVQLRSKTFSNTKVD
jgi:hypothetical protein